MTDVVERIIGVYVEVAVLLVDVKY